MRHHLTPAIKVFAALFVLTGFVYPLFVTAVSQFVFAETANGSLVKVNGRIVGSRLLAQKLSQNAYFHPRPSVNDYNTLSSGGSNLSPISVKLKVQAEAASAGTPPDLVFASGSGLDPEISSDGARFQVKRIAEARNISEEKIHDILRQAELSPQFGFLGVTRVNVLILNAMLDETFGSPIPPSE